MESMFLYLHRRLADIEARFRQYAGVGFPDDLDFKNTESLGLQLVNTLRYQLNGGVQLVTGSGTTFGVAFERDRGD